MCEGGLDAKLERVKQHLLELHLLALEVEEKILMGTIVWGL